MTTNSPTMAEDTSIPLELIAQSCEQMKDFVESMDLHAIDVAVGNPTEASYLKGCLDKFCKQLDVVATQVERSRNASSTKGESVKGRKESQISELEADVTSLQDSPQSAFYKLEKEYQAKLEAMREAQENTYQVKLKALIEARKQERQVNAAALTQAREGEGEEHVPGVQPARTISSGLDSSDTDVGAFASAAEYPQDIESIEDEFEDEFNDLQCQSQLKLEASQNWYENALKRMQDECDQKLEKKRAYFDELKVNIKELYRDLDEREEDFKNREEESKDWRKRIFDQNAALKDQHKREIAVLQERHKETLRVSSEAYLDSLQALIKRIHNGSGSAVFSEAPTSPRSTYQSLASSNVQSWHSDADNSAHMDNQPPLAQRRTRDDSDYDADDELREPRAKKPRVARTLSMSAMRDRPTADRTMQAAANSGPAVDVPVVLANPSSAAGVLTVPANPIPAVDMSTAQQKGEEIWQMMLPDWDITPDEKERIRAQLTNVFARGRSIETMTEMIDRYIVGAATRVPPFPKPCLFGSILQHKAGPGGSNMIARLCPYCRQKQGRICLWAIHAPNVASGFPPRINGKYDGKIPWQSSAQPQTIRVSGQEVRWILKRRKQNFGEQDDPQVIMKKLRMT